MEAHGGDLNGFFLIRGEAAKLDSLQSSADWHQHMVRAMFHLQGSGAVRAFAGDAVAGRMELWQSSIPD